MKIVRDEHIYLSNEDYQLWVDFGDLLNAIQKKTENREVETLISDITAKLFDLSYFMEGEE